MKYRACPVCGGTESRDVGPYRNESAVLAGMRKIECLNCGLVYASPTPSADAWADYNSGYFANAHGDGGASRAAAQFRSGLARLRARHTNDYLARHGVKVSRVLEIGPGYGEFARAFLSERPDVSYVAVETDSARARELRDAGIEVADTVSAVGADVQLVVISHVLEHTRDPLAFLAETTARLSSGGALFIEVPCRDYLYKDGDEPHLLFFEKKPMALALEKTGFGAVELTYHGDTIGRLQRRERELSPLLSQARRVGRRLHREMNLGAHGLSRGEWGMVRPFRPERLSAEPARWLRAVATKR